MSQAVRRKVLIKNAIANVGSGTAAALLAVILPPVLLRYLSKDIYSVWALILQVGAYTGLLNFGLQVAVGRFVAHYETTGDVDSRDGVVSAAWVSLILASLVAMLCMGTASFWFPDLFPKIPEFLRGEARMAMAWVGLSLAAGLPFSVFMGVFIGRQRHEIPAFIQVGSRLLTGVILVSIAVSGGTIVGMAKAFAAINLGTYIIQYLAHRSMANGCHIHHRLANLRAAKELWGFCFSLNVWNVAMLMVSGLDLVIVGRIDFRAVAAYSIAIGLVNFIAGLQNAVFNVLIPAGAVLGAEENATRLQEMLINATRYGVLLLMASSLPLLLGGRPLLDLYLRSSGLAASTLPLLRLLVIGNLIRLTATPYSVLLIGTGQQRILLITPLVEGIVNLSLSIILGLYMGARGVAIGTIMGSIVGISCNLLFNFPRTKMLASDRGRYILQGLLKPLAGAVPIVLAFLVINLHDFPIRLSACIMSAGLLATVLCVWEFALAKGERELLLVAIFRRMPI